MYYLHFSPSVQSSSLLVAGRLCWGCLCLPSSKDSELIKPQQRSSRMQRRAAEPVTD